MRYAVLDNSPRRRLSRCLSVAALLAFSLPLSGNASAPLPGEAETAEQQKVETRQTSDLQGFETPSWHAIPSRDLTVDEATPAPPASAAIAPGSAAIAVATAASTPASAATTTASLPDPSQQEAAVIMPTVARPAKASSQDLAAATAEPPPKPHTAEEFLPKKVPPEWQAWQKVQKAGSEAFDNNEFGKAERLLKEAVRMARDIGPGDIRIAKSPGDLGRLLEVRGRFSEAEPLLEEEFYLKDRAVGNSDGQIVADMEALIRFYLTEGTADKAPPLSEDLLAFVQGKFREQADQRKGKMTLQQGQPLSGWAGTAGPKMHDPMLEWSITCDKIGDLYRFRNNADMADKFYKTALDVKATVLGKQHLSLANSYDNLGSICLMRGTMDDAESYFRDALNITDGVLEKGDPEVFQRIDKLARCLIKEKKFSEAEELYLRAIRTWGGERSEGQRALFALG